MTYWVDSKLVQIAQHDKINELLVFIKIKEINLIPNPFQNEKENYYFNVCYYSINNAE